MVNLLLYRYERFYGTAVGRGSRFTRHILTSQDYYQTDLHISWDLVGYPCPIYYEARSLKFGLGGAPGTNGLG